MENVYQGAVKRNRRIFEEGTHGDLYVIYLWKIKPSKTQVKWPYLSPNQCLLCIMCEYKFKTGTIGAKYGRFIQASSTLSCSRKLKLLVSTF